MNCYIYSSPASMDVGVKFTLDQQIRAFAPVLDYCLMDENTQVNGFVVVEDMSDLTIKHQTMFGIDTAKKMMSSWIVSIESV